MTNRANDTLTLDCTLHEEAKAADRTIYTIQSLLSVCKHVADYTVEAADRKDDRRTGDGLFQNRGKGLSLAWYSDWVAHFQKMYRKSISYK